MSSLCKIFQSAIHVNKLTQNLPVVTCVRWRMPRFVPRGKTKEFILPPPRKPVDDDYRTFMVEYQHYKTEIRSLRCSTSYIFIFQEHTIELVRGRPFDSEGRGGGAGTFWNSPKYLTLYPAFDGYLDG